MKQSKDYLLGFADGVARSGIRKGYEKNNEYLEGYRKGISG